MGWILFGFLTAVGVETFIRITSSYQREEQPRTRQQRVQVSLPWYLTAGAAYGVYQSTRKKKA
jgi:hypothetical protein